MAESLLLLCLVHLCHSNVAYSDYGSRRLELLAGKATPALPFSPSCDSSSTQPRVCRARRGRWFLLIRYFACFSISNVRHIISPCFCLARADGSHHGKVVISPAWVALAGGEEASAWSMGSALQRARPAWWYEFRCGSLDMM
jgi:hypothetical protein